MLQSARLAVAFSLLCGFSLHAKVWQSEEEWNVFGTDNRVEMTSEDYPWSTIGKLSSGCTGTLVGKNLMLTAAHCVYDEKEEILSNFTYFYPNLINNVYATRSWMEYIWSGTKNPRKSRGDDWAIVRLSEPLGDTYGWMGVDSGEYDTVTNAGYASNFQSGLTAGVHVGCKVTERQPKTFYHDCDNGRGASGGPIFIMKGKAAYVVGIAVAEFREDGDKSLSIDKYDHKYANIAVPAATFLEKLKGLKK